MADYLNANTHNITPSGEVSTLAGAVLRGGYVDGANLDARFQEPYGIAVDASGVLYVTYGTTVHILK